MVLSATSCPTRASNACLIWAAVLMVPACARAKKGARVLLLLLQHQILMVPSPFARCLHCLHPSPVVGRDELMYRLFGNATMIGNLLSGACCSRRIESRRFSRFPIEFASTKRQSVSSIGENIWILA